MNHHTSHPINNRADWGQWRKQLNTREKPFTTQVGSFPKGKSPYGLLDMAGNTWEWVDSWYEAYLGNKINSNDYGRKYRVIRGGCWQSPLNEVRVTQRGGIEPTQFGSFVSFRCASKPLKSI